MYDTRVVHVQYLYGTCTISNTVKSQGYALAQNDAVAVGVRSCTVYLKIAHMTQQHQAALHQQQSHMLRSRPSMLSKGTMLNWLNMKAGCLPA